jgi:transposase
MAKVLLITEVTPSSAAQAEPATLFAAVELSKAVWLVGLQSPDRDKISLQRVTGGDAQGLLELLEKTRRRATAALGRPVRIVCCYEAGFDGFWLHRLLCERGIDNHVIDPASILVNRKARRAKTDRIDVEGLLRTLMAFCRGEREVCRMVHVPSREQEDVRHQTRERERLVAARIGHVNRIKGLLMTQGIRDFHPIRQDWRERLRRLRTGDGRALLPCLGARIERECALLWALLKELAALEKEIATRLKSSHEADADQARRADAAERHRRARRSGAGAGGVLPQLCQPPRGRPLSGAGTLSLGERLDAARPGARQVRQSARPAHRGRARLAVAALPAGQCPDGVVPRTGRERQGTPAQDHDCGAGPQADGGAVALSDHRRRADRRHPEGVRSIEVSEVS